MGPDVLIDFDLCSTCIEAGGANAHNPFHAFFEIREPGRVIVHNVYTGDGERDDSLALRHALRSSAATTEPPQSEQPARPIIHLANCDLCASRIQGPRYVRSQTRVVVNILTQVISEMPPVS